jgi:hypothetical protein
MFLTYLTKEKEGRKRRREDIPKKGNILLLKIKYGL